MGPTEQCNARHDDCRPGWDIAVERASYNMMHEPIHYPKWTKLNTKMAFLPPDKYRLGRGTELERSTTKTPCSNRV
eukprot:9382482-Ditylum_brightwellii.AAC.1